MKEIFFLFIEYEQRIVEWLDHSKVSLCPSCAKPFGLSRRKHHCRLDGFVICDDCSQFLSFSMARKKNLFRLNV
jgi:rabenosyn-5